MTAAWRSNNAEHNRKYQREWQRREDRRARARAAHIKRKFGLTPEEFEAMVAEQQGLCAICQKPPVGKRRQQDDFDGEPELRPLDIDHDPKTGRVRGLLCNPCNQAIGLLRDDPESMRRAAVYVEAGDSGLVV